MRCKEAAATEKGSAVLDLFWQKDHHQDAACKKRRRCGTAPHAWRLALRLTKGGVRGGGGRKRWSGMSLLFTHGS